MENSQMSFGVSGIPGSTSKPNYLTGLKRIAELGLDAFELPFVQFVTMSEETAEAFSQELKSIEMSYGKRIRISVHAPYFVNLNATDEKKITESIQRILKAAERGGLAGAETIVFHPGFYLTSTVEEAYSKVSKSIKTMLAQAHDAGINPMLRPETTGKPNQFGTLDELIRLSQDFNYAILPCIDFAHLHARTNGAYNTEEAFEEIVDKVHDGLGENGMKHFHIHYSGIEYSEKGERKHVLFRDSDAAYEALLRVLKRNNATGVIICESPGMEDDALLLKRTYASLP